MVPGSRTVAVLAALALALGRVEAAGPTPRTITAHTGEPRVDVRGGSPTRLDPRAAYDTRSADDKLRIPPEHDPWSELPDTRYGLFGQNRESRVTFAVRNDDGRRQVRIDANRNGDLRDDPPLLSEPVEFGQRVHAELQDPHVILALSFFDGQDATALMMSGTIREGTLDLDGKQVKFSVHGQMGRYADDQEAYFDTSGDGEIDDSRFSDERYLPQHGHVNLAGHSWSFSVSEDGSRLRLEQLPDKRPGRIPLAPGNPAPDFAFTDIDGKGGRLSDYRGRVVVLYLWGTWCSPCRGETPHLLEAYRRYHERGLDILAFAKKDQPDRVRAYVEEYGIAWRQTIQDYRVSAIPNALIIGRDGRIAERAIRAKNLLEGLKPLFEDPE
jgi:thiol-disulfide isomerase/thioredoxin